MDGPDRPVCTVARRLRTGNHAGRSLAGTATRLVVPVAVESHAAAPLALALVHSASPPVGRAAVTQDTATGAADQAWPNASGIHHDFRLRHGRNTPDACDDLTDFLVYAG